MFFNTPSSFWDFVWMRTLDDASMSQVIVPAMECPDNQTLIAFVRQAAGGERTLSDASFENYRCMVQQCHRCSWILGKAYVLCEKGGVEPEDNVDAYITVLRELFAQETKLRLQFVVSTR